MRPTGNTTQSLILFLIFCCCVAALHASPTEDLASPSQETRDAAAKILRQSYKAPPRTNWDSLVASLKPGTPEEAVDVQLQSSNLISRGGYASGRTEVKLYRLDTFWVLSCSFTNSTSTNKELDEVTLEETIQDFWADPPTNFTGSWRVYWANGETNQEISFKKGLRNGPANSFYKNGLKSVVSHYTNDRADGEEVGFYPSGRIKYKGQYVSDHQVGRWVWYKEDGSVELERDYGAN